MHYCNVSLNVASLFYVEEVRENELHFKKCFLQHMNLSHYSLIISVKRLSAKDNE